MLFLSEQGLISQICCFSTNYTNIRKINKGSKNLVKAKICKKHQGFFGFC